MMDPRLKAILNLLDENSRPEFSDENLQVIVEADNPESAREGLELAKESLGEVQDLCPSSGMLKRKKDDDEEEYY